MSDDKDRDHAEHASSPVIVSEDPRMRNEDDIDEPRSFDAALRRCTNVLGKRSFHDTPCRPN